MPWSSNSDIPDAIRSREELADWSDDEWIEFREVFNALVGQGRDESEAIPIAIEQVKAATVEWVEALHTGTLHLDDQRIDVDAEMLQATASEFRRRIRDLHEAGLRDFPPLTHPLYGPHQDSGRRDGVVVDMKAEGGVLWAKAGFNESAAEDLEADRLEKFSVNIAAQHRDPQTGEVYGPHLRELSPTNHPKDKAARLAAACEAGDIRGLRLSHAEDRDMADEQTEQTDEEVEAADETVEPPESDEPGTGAADEVSDGADLEAQESPSGPKTFDAFLDGLLDKVSIPERFGGPTRQERIEELADMADGVDVEDIEAVIESGAIPPDPLIDAAAEMVPGAEAQQLRRREFPALEAPSGDSDTDESGAGPDSEEAKAAEDVEEVEASDTDADLEAMDGQHGQLLERIINALQRIESELGTQSADTNDRGDADPEKEEGEGVAASDVPDNVVTRERFEQLQERVEAAERMSGLNTERRSEPGEPEDVDGVITSSDDAIEAAERQLGEDADRKEVVRLARKMMPDNEETAR